MLCNKSETMIHCRIGTQGRIEYFQTFGAVAILFMKLKLEN